MTDCRRQLPCCSCASFSCSLRSSSRSSGDGCTMGEPVSAALFERVQGARAVARYALLTVVAAIILLPIYATLVGSLKPRHRVLQDMLVPGPLTLQTFADAWTQGHLARYLVNSLVVAILV